VDKLCDFEEEDKFYCNNGIPYEMDSEIVSDLNEMEKVGY
jgi:hypothetical protein